MTGLSCPTFRGNLCISRIAQVGINSMQQRSPWETYSRYTCEEIPSLFRNPKIHYRVHKIPPIDPIWSEIIPFHVFLHPYIFKMLFNIIFHLRPGHQFQTNSFFYLRYIPFLILKILPVSHRKQCSHCSGLCNHSFDKKKNSVVLVRKRTIPTERPQPVGEVSANFSW
jgi:hypothetical protein